MKKNILHLITAIAVQIMWTGFASSQTTQLDINFNDGQAVFVPIHSDAQQPSYTLSVTNGLLNIASAKRAQDWSFLGLFGIQLDISGLPTVQFRVKTDNATTFIVRLKSPMKSNPEEWSQVEKSIALQPGDFQYFFFDISDDILADPDFDAGNIREIHVECTKGWENSFTGNVSLDFIKAGYPDQSKPTAGTWYHEDFNDGTLPGGLTYGADYTASPEDGAMVVEISKDGRWTPFTLVLDSLYDFSTDPYLNILMRTDEDLVMQVFLVDANGGGYRTELVGSQYKYTELVAGQNEYRQVRLFKGRDFLDVTLDFTDASGSIVDLSKIEKIVFTANGTAMTYNGKFVIDEITAGSIAEKKAYIGQIPDHQVYRNTSGSKSILLPEIMNADLIRVSGGENLIRQVTVDAISYSQSTENNHPVTYGYTTIHYAVIPDTTGSDTLVVTADGKSGYGDNNMRFVITVAGNQQPVLKPLNDVTCRIGVPVTLELQGISDGDPAVEQSLSVISAADNEELVDTVIVDYTTGNRSGKIMFTPLQVGTTTISVRITDSEGAYITQSFEITVFENINGVPKIDQAFKSDVVNSAGEQLITLTGISDGDDGSQTLTITASSSVAGVISEPVIVYEPGDSTAVLKFTPVQGNTGVTTLTIILTDDGGSPENDGDKTAEMSFLVETLNPPISGYVIDLAQTGAISWFSPENVGIEYFIDIVDTLGSKALRIQMKDKWTYGGIWFQLPDELNLKKSPVVSYEVFSLDKQTWHWNYLYHAHGTDGTLDRNIQNSESHQYPAAAGEWTNLLFDYRDPGDLNNGEGEPIDAGRINAILLNMHDSKPSWPFTNATATVYYRNIRLGDSCSFDPATPVCSVDPVADQTVFENSGNHTLMISGISNGKGDIAGVSVTASSYNTSIIPKPVLSSLNEDGTALLTFTANATGSSVVTLRITAEGSATITAQFSISVVKPDPENDALVTVDITDENQTIRGFGAFEPESRFVDLYTQDLGASVIRLGIIGNQWEPVNDNDDPEVLNMEGFNYDAFDWDYLRNLKEKGVEHFILTSWSPPAWMKRNLSLDHKEQAVGWGFTDNRLEVYYYNEFAESMLAVVKAFKEMAGIDLLALGLQNEPFFNEPYPSAILDAPHFIDLIKIVSDKLKANGYDHIGFYMPEQVFGIGSADASCLGFLEKLREDPVADEVTDYFGVHGYDQTGITPGFPDYSEWKDYYEAAVAEPNPKEMWMTETTFGYDGWSSSLSLAGALHGSLWAGNISWWTTYGFSGDYISDNMPNISYYAAKCYFRYIRPGAVRVTTATTHGDIMSTAFKNTDESLVMVLVNKSGTAITSRIQGDNLPDEYTLYRTSEKEKFSDGGTVKLSDGSFILPASSITTLVATYNARLTMNQVADVETEKNSGENEIPITGISNGYGNVEGLSLSHEVSNENLFSELFLSEINGDGTAAMTFTPAPDATGFSQVKLYLTDGSETRTVTFFIIVGDITGTRDDAEKTVLIYPNPARDKVSIEMPERIYDQVSILDNMGRIVLQNTISSDKVTLNVDKLSRGLYLVELRNEKNKKVYLLSIQ